MILHAPHGIIIYHLSFKKNYHLSFIIYHLRKIIIYHLSFIIYYL